jgi:glycosyltransferase involved in cell wall biosynthesis
MRIGVFTNTFMPALNGVAKSIEMFRRGLTALGHDVFVITAAVPRPGDVPDYVVQCRACPAGRHNDYAIALPYSLPEARVDALELDIIHSHHVIWVGRWGLLYGRRHGLPVVATVHTHFDSCLPYVPVIRSLARPLLRRAYRRLCNECDIVIAPTATRAQQLREIAVNAPIEVVPNGVDLAEFQALDRERWRTRWGLRPTEVAIGYIGRLGPEKRCDVLLRAFARCARDLDVRLILVGNGPSQPAMQRLARAMHLGDRVVFQGPVPHEAIPSCHAALDIFAHASPLETMPMSILEAMAAGTVVAALDVPGPRDIIQSGRTGMLAPNDEAAFADLLRTLIVSPPLRARLARAARAEVGSFDHVQSGARLLEVYRCAVATRLEGSGEPAVSYVYGAGSGSWPQR